MFRVADRTILASVATLIGTALISTGVPARDLPPGPYRQDCRNERIEQGWLLRATCRKENGEWRDSSLDLRSCPSGAYVYNRNAYLHCGDGRSGRRDYDDRDRDHGWQRDGYGSPRGGYVSYYELPRGPYRGECRHERVEGGYLLRATCPKENGDMRDASLDLRTCGPNPVVYNSGAYLRCR